MNLSKKPIKQVLHTAGIASEPVRNAAKMRNVLMDQAFYDVSALTTLEQQQLIRSSNREGSLITVFPRSADRPMCYYESVKAFSEKGKGVSKHFVVAGVGSSDLGGAALARNVADFYDLPVTAIVSGYGMSDLMTEAMGGWFALGQANQLHHWFAELDEFDEDEDDILSRFADAGRRMIGFVRGSPDSLALLNLLLTSELPMELVLGHSKGCLSIANALYGLVNSEDKTAIEARKKTRFVTTGAVVEVPEQFQEDTSQFLGAVDWFGGLNSRLSEVFKPVTMAWHHTNTSLPMHMDIMSVLAQLPKSNQKASA